MGRSRRVALSAILLGMPLLAAPWLRPLLRERKLRSAVRPVDVLLVTLDPTRADHLGCYGHKDASTPCLDSLAREGVRFQRAYSHVPLTLPSHTSILTGLFPSHHGLHDNGGFVLAPHVPTPAEAFLAAGYPTGAFGSAFVLR